MRAQTCSPPPSGLTQFLANRHRRGLLPDRVIGPVNSLSRVPTAVFQRRRRGRPYYVPYRPFPYPVGRDSGKLPGREEGGEMEMADSYAALLGVGSPTAAALAAESGRCVEDLFLYLFVVLIRPFIRALP